jgi:hypothetical protein
MAFFSWLSFPFFFNPCTATGKHALNKIEGRESFVDAENGMYMFSMNILRTLFERY